MEFLSNQHLEKLERANYLNSKYSSSDTHEIIKSIVKDEFQNELVIVSSFGAESAVLLHQVSKVDTSVPVLFLETFKHFKETIEYRDELIRKFGLSQLITAFPNKFHLEADDPNGELFKTNPNLCCDRRKTMPMMKALSNYKCFITGRKRFQTEDRKDMRLFEVQGEWIRFNPLYNFTKEDLDHYFQTYDLPIHPLVEEGYNSIGCFCCTKKSDKYREGRWMGTTKTECGIHFNSEDRKNSKK